MKILVTGGAGYIGSHTCVCLLNAGYDVVVADNLSNSSREALRRVEEIAGKPCKFYQIDVTDKAALETVFSENELDCVIHFAGLKAVGESVQKPVEYYRNNLDSTLALLEAMRAHKVRQFIFSSSATVYRTDVEMPVDENSPLGCINPYGWTKFMCEQILRDAARANPEWSVVLLRYFNPIGAHESGRIGEDPSGIPNNLMPYITQVASGRLEKLTVFGNDYPTHDGTGVRDYIHVMDLAQGHVDAIRYAQRNSGCEAFNLGTGVGYSVMDLVNTFERVNGVPVKHVFGARRAGDPAAIYARPDKAKAILGWESRHTLEDMCRDAWNWQKQNPKGYK